MRLCTPASPCLAAAAALLATTPPAPALAAPAPAAAAPASALAGPVSGPGVTAPAAAAPVPAGPAAPAPLPACTAAEDHTFPLTTRVHGGPAGYRAGGGYGTWYLDLTNTTDRTCEDIHPVIVLVDERRALEPDQPRLEFYDGTRPHPVRLRRTDADELIGVLADDAAGFPGFTVGPGRTLTVRVRLALTSDAVPNEVTANAAVVQRRGGDGEWVGQSEDYRFRIDAGPAAPAASPSAGGLPFADELAGTGQRRTYTLLAAATVLVAAGATAVALARRRR